MDEQEATGAGQDLGWLLDDLGEPGRAFPAGRDPVPGRAGHRRLAAA